MLLKTAPAANVIVPGLGDRSLAAFRAGRVLARHQPEVSHECSRVHEALEVAKLGDDGRRTHEVEATQRH